MIVRENEQDAPVINPSYIPIWNKRSWFKTNKLDLGIVIPSHIQIKHPEIYDCMDREQVQWVDQGK